MKLAPYIAIEGPIGVSCFHEVNGFDDGDLVHLDLCLTNTNAFAFPKEPTHRSPNLAVRDGPWKLLLQTDGSAAALYELDSDPKETTNRAGDQPDLTRRLSDLALGWWRSLPAAPGPAGR